MGAAVILPVCFFAAAFIAALPLLTLQDPNFVAVMGMVMMGGITTLWAVLRQKKITLPSSGFSLALLGLWGWMAITTAASPAPFQSMIALCVFSLLPLTFFILYTAPDRARILRILPQCLLGVITLLSIPAIIQGITTRAHWPMLDPNILATLFALTVPLSMAGFYKSTTTAHKIAYIVACIMLAAALFSTGSRGGVIALCVALLPFIILNGAHFVRAMAVPVILMTATIAVMATTAPNPTTLHRLSTLTQQNPDASGITPRVIMNQGAIKMMMDHPVLGTGPGTFMMVYPGYRASLSDTSLGAWAHCDPLQWGAEAGIPALALFYILLICVFGRTIRACKNAMLSERLNILAPFTALLVIAIQSHIQFPLQIPALLIATGVLLAAWHNATSVIFPENDKNFVLYSTHIRAGIGACTLIIFTVFSVITLRFSMAEYEMRAANNAWNADVPDTADIMRHLAKADRWGTDSFIAPELVLAKINILIIGESKQIDRTQLIGDTTLLLDTAAGWNPYLADIDALRGDLAVAMNLPKAATSHYKTTLQKNPAHFETRLKLARLYMQQGDKTTAVQLLDMGLRMPHPEWYRMNAVTMIKEYGLVQ